jgi:hypothetical protein
MPEVSELSKPQQNTIAAKIPELPVKSKHEKLKYSIETGVAISNEQKKVLEALISKLPTSDLEDRLLAAESDHWKNQVFFSQRTKDKKIFTLPRNVESFADNLILGSIMRVADAQGYEIALSTIDVKTIYLEKANSAWFAGYVHELMDPSETYPSGTSSFVKGRQSCILERFKPADVAFSRFYKKTKKEIGSVVSAMQVSK